MENDRLRKGGRFAAHQRASGAGSVVKSRYFEAWKPVIIIIDDAGMMTRFDFVRDTVDLKKGVYYVDLWATWCQPCMAEMAYNYPVDSLLAARQIRRLYISLDETDHYSRWTQAVFNHHLGGYHVLAGEELLLFLQREFGSGASILLPRYLLLKDGMVVNKFAARPSNFQQLVGQIEQLEER